MIIDKKNVLEKKTLCPLLTATQTTGTIVDCYEDKCEWYDIVYCQCCVPLFASVLEEIWRIIWSKSDKYRKECDMYEQWKRKKHKNIAKRKKNDSTDS